MSDAILDSDELSAVREAMSQGAPARRRDPAVAQNPTSVALIADDRAADRARPSATKIVERWARGVRRVLGRSLPAAPEVEVGAAVNIDGAVVRDDLAGGWLCAVEVERRRGHAIVQISGPLIESVAVWLLGGDAGAPPAPDRVPSAAALSLFDATGNLLVAALGAAWREEQGSRMGVVDVSVEEWRHGIDDREIVVVATLHVSGATSGRLRLYAHPELLVAPPAPPEVAVAPTGAIHEALAEVPIELRVELGRAFTTAGAFAALTPGAVLALDRFVDDLLPVACGGVVKAFGRAQIARGAMAIEIVDPEPRAPRRQPGQPGKEST